MTKIRLGIAAIALLIIGTACTPQEIALWQAWHADDPAAAEAALSPAEARPPTPEASVSPASVVEDRAPEPEVHCYHLVGGTFCAPDGTAKAADYAAQQADYYATHGVADPGPLPHSDYPIAPVFPESARAPTPDGVRCFILPGGTFCYPDGSPEYARAEQDEAAYLAAHTDLIETP